MFGDLLGDPRKRRAVLLSLLVVGFAGSALGAMTWSYYADSDSSAANQVQGETMNLHLGGADSRSGDFTVTGAPTSAASYTYTLTNDGAAPADHVEVAVSFTENDPGGEPTDPDLENEINAGETASLVKVTTLEYRNDTGAVLYDATANMKDTNGNKVLDLQDVQSQQGSLDDLAPPQAGGGNTTKLAIEVQLVNDDGAFATGGNTAGNLTGSDEDLMADGIDVTVHVTLNQDASQ